MLYYFVKTISVFLNCMFSSNILDENYLRLKKTEQGDKMMESMYPW